MACVTMCVCHVDAIPQVLCHLRKRCPLGAIQTLKDPKRFNMPEIRLLDAQFFAVGGVVVAFVIVDSSAYGAILEKRLTLRGSVRHTVGSTHLEIQLTSGPSGHGLRRLCKSGLQTVKHDLSEAMNPHDIVSSIATTLSEFEVKQLFIVGVPRIHACTSPFQGSRLIRWENKYVALASANAYISTLGGGHFLCRQIGDAVRMALMQMQIAYALGDDALILRCHVHLVYCNIQIGKFGTAMRRLKALERIAIVRGDDVLLNMVDSGKRYCRNTYRLYALGVLHITYWDSVSTQDEYYRQRLARLSPAPR